MFSTEELSFAAKFPFTEKARQIIKENDVSVDGLSTDLIDQAVKRLSSKGPFIEMINLKEEQMNELKLFALEKLLLSLTKNSSIKRIFSKEIASHSLEFISKEFSKIPEDLDLISKELNMDFEFRSADNTFIIPVIEFLKVSFLDKNLYLVHQKVKGGNVFLSRDLFFHFLNFYLYNHLMQSINEIDLSRVEVPAGIKKAVKKIDSLSFFEMRDEDGRMIPLTSKVELNAFPDCMQSLYSRLGSGEGLPHMERFFLACFLVQVGMPAEEIVRLFSKAPNFNESTTRYHIENIRKKGYSSPSAEKLRSHGIQCSCNNNPVYEYKNNLRKFKRKSVKK